MVWEVGKQLANAEHIGIVRGASRVRSELGHFPGVCYLELRCM